MPCLPGKWTGEHQVPDRLRFLVTQQAPRVVLQAAAREVFFKAEMGAWAGFPVSSSSCVRDGLFFFTALDREVEPGNRTRRGGGGAEVSNEVEPSRRSIPL